MVFNLCSLVLIVGLLVVGEGPLNSVATSVMQIAGIRTASGGNGVSVDSGGQIRYRSRSVTLEDLSEALKRDLQTGGAASVAVVVDAKADAARVAQVLSAAGAAGAQTVRLSTTQE
jgi:biopolymer transport protein ExbD